MATNTKLDKIHIRDLLLRCIVGLNDWEREKTQDILINITLYADLKTACRTDRIEDTVDYKAIKQKVVDMVEASSYTLIERLAEHIAAICLEHPRVQRVKVLLDKTGALRYARSVAVEIVREKKKG
ncbi:dihydroneopterin aldolase [Candidatus Poribacteria bacterium]|nr:dihydroneopterin aldolase [Candidatus Poribacteria bacterium]